MDYIESEHRWPKARWQLSDDIELAQQASQMTMYDVKTYYNQAKNAVLNVSETEAKVREATNDDPW